MWIWIVIGIVLLIALIAVAFWLGYLLGFKIGANAGVAIARYLTENPDANPTNEQITKIISASIMDQKV